MQYWVKGEKNVAMPTNQLDGIAPLRHERHVFLIGRYIPCDAAGHGLFYKKLPVLPDGKGIPRQEPCTV
jgi:hypothetical protein